MNDNFGEIGSPRFRRRKAVIGVVAIVGASALLLSGCSGGTQSADTNLTLNIGTLLPQTGSLATLGPPAIEAANLAAADINAANQGIKINLTQKDSGDTSTNIATPAVTSLLGDNVSAIVGAESSSVSFGVINQIVKAGVLMMSPANTSPAFTTYADDGFYFRTAPSDVLQGRVLAKKIATDGATKLGIIYQNDSYGQGLNENVTKDFAEDGGEVVAQVPFDPKSTNFSAEVDKVLAAGPDAVLVISFDQIKQIVPELKKHGFDFTKFYGTDGNFDVIDSKYTNADIAGAQFSNPGAQPTPEFKARLQAQTVKDGVAPLTVFSYAAETYDAVVLLALAALQGKGVDGATLKNNLQKVSGGGTKATDFTAAAQLIKEGKDVDYDGLSGQISFDSNGDPNQAYISIYKYGPQNTSVFESSEFGELPK